MRPDLFRRLRAHLERLPTEARQHAESQIALVRESGITSLSGLLAMVQDGHTEITVRLAGCQLLSMLRDRRAAGALVKVFRDADDKGLMWEAAKALSQLRGSGVALSLVELLRSSVPEKAAAAAWSLGWLLDRKAIPALRAVVVDKDRDNRVRAHAVEALGVLKAREAVPDLIAVSTDKSAEVRYWAAYALGQIGDPAALPVLTHMVELDDAEVPGWGSVKAEAEDAIGQILAQQNEP